MMLKKEELKILKSKLEKSLHYMRVLKSCYSIYQPEIRIAIDNSIRLTIKFIKSTKLELKKC